MASLKKKTVDIDWDDDDEDASSVKGPQSEDDNQSVKNSLSPIKVDAAESKPSSSSNAVKKAAAENGKKAAPEKPKNGKKVPIHFSDDDEDDDDDDDEDQDDDDDDESRNSIAKVKSQVAKKSFRADSEDEDDHPPAAKGKKKAAAPSTAKASSYFEDDADEGNDAEESKPKKETAKKQQQQASSAKSTADDQKKNGKKPSAAAKEAATHDEDEDDEEEDSNEVISKDAYEKILNGLSDKQKKQMKDYHDRAPKRPYAHASAYYKKNVEKDFVKKYPQFKEPLRKFSELKKTHPQLLPVQKIENDFKKIDAEWKTEFEEWKKEHPEWAKVYLYDKRKKNEQKNSRKRKPAAKMEDAVKHVDVKQDDDEHIMQLKKSLNESRDSMRALVKENETTQAKYDTVCENFLKQQELSEKILEMYEEKANKRRKMSADD